MNSHILSIALACGLPLAACSGMDVIIAQVNQAAGTGAQPNDAQDSIQQDGSLTPSQDGSLPQDSSLSPSQDGGRSQSQAPGDAPLDTAVSCHKSDECSHDMFCAKNSCNEPVGVCRPIDICPPGDPFDPYCGCDNITYWNDCFRQINGSPASARGACTNPIPCNHQLPCPVNGASCAHIIPGTVSCPSGPGLRHQNDQGVCWVTPFPCPIDAGDGFYVECDPMARQECEGLCEAIHEGTTHKAVSACP